MIKLKNGILNREPIPQFLVGLAPETLLDLSFSDPALGVSDCKWLPEVDQSPALTQYQRYGAETLTRSGNVVVVIRAVVPWTAAEIAAELSVVKTALAKEIDAAVLAIYDKPITLGKEYEAREKAATDYKAAGYTGTVPARLAGFATPAGLTPRVAADLVLSQASQLRGALDSLSDLRMQKQSVQRAATEAEARTIHTATMASIAAIAAALGG